jgi:hypothetical protein
VRVPRARSGAEKQRVFRSARDVLSAPASFNQCADNSTFKSFELAQADCFPREAKDEICNRAQTWAKDNDHDAESMKYSKQILSFYGMTTKECPL